MYDKDGFQVPNSINRFAIGDRDKLSFNADGSLDIYVQAESPGKDKESNWLPAPKNALFQPTLRIYSLDQRLRTAHGHRRRSGGCIERPGCYASGIDMNNLRARIVGLAAAMACAAALLCAPSAPAKAQNISTEEAQEIAREAYIYAYPMVVMEIIRRVGTNVAEVAGLAAP
jgi:hypothetical protein